MGIIDPNKKYDISEMVSGDFMSAPPVSPMAACSPG